MSQTNPPEQNYLRILSLTTFELFKNSACSYMLYMYISE